MPSRNAVLATILIPAVIALAIWAFTAVYVRPDVDFLWSFARLLTGVSIVVSAGFAWAFTGGPKVSILSAAAIGALSIVSAVVTTSGIDSDVVDPLQMGITFAVLGIVIYWQRQVMKMR